MTSDKREAAAVIIHWVDSAMNWPEQKSREDWMKEADLMRGFSAGWLLHEDKEKVVLAMDWFPKNDQFRNVSTYPKAAIAKIERLAPKRRKR